jgi:hypothetical protein
MWDELFGPVPRNLRPPLRRDDVIGTQRSNFVRPVRAFSLVFLHRPLDRMPGHFFSAVYRRACAAWKYVFAAVRLFGAKTFLCSTEGSQKLRRICGYTKDWTTGHMS